IVIYASRKLAVFASEACCALPSAIDEPDRNAWPSFRRGVERSTFDERRIVLLDKPAGLAPEPPDPTFVYSTTSMKEALFRMFGDLRAYVKPNANGGNAVWLDQPARVGKTWPTPHWKQKIPISYWRSFRNL